jgi:hypothetical protein
MKAAIMVCIQVDDEGVSMIESPKGNFPFRFSLVIVILHHNCQTVFPFQEINKVSKQESRSKGRVNTGN